MDSNLEKAVKPEISKETLLEVVKELQEIIIGMLETEDEAPEAETEIEDPEIEITPTNPSPIGDPEKNDINWPVNKSAWGNMFDPLDFVKRKFNTKERMHAAEMGHAMPDGSYPINTKDDLSNAIRTFGLGGSDPKVKAHIKRRARALGAEDMIPENWK